MKMNEVITVRLPKEDIEIVKRLAMEAKKDKSTTVRDLVELGKVYFAITQYQEGKISLGRASEIAGVSISEMIDLLAKLGIEGNLEVEDYLESAQVADEIIK